MFGAVPLLAVTGCVTEVACVALRCLLELGVEPVEGGAGGHGCQTSPQSPHSSAYSSVRSLVVMRVSLMVSVLPQDGQVAAVVVGGEVGDGGESVVADAVGAAPVPGGGGVGVVDGDGGGAGLAAAEDVDAAGQAVFGGVEVLVADDGFDVIQDGDGHDGCLSVRDA